MPNIFETKPGTVVVIPTAAGPAPMAIGVEGLFRGAGGAGGKLILSDIDFDREVGLQIGHTFDAGVYVYLFRERAGTFRAAGYIVGATCEGSGDDGLSLINGYFDRYNAARLQRPIDIVIGAGSGAIATQGLLQRMRINLAKPEQAIGQFGLEFRTLPQR